MNASAERSAAPAPKQYRVADLLVDVGRQRVTRADAEIPLPKLSFDLLLALIRSAPDLLSHDQLMAQVWPGLIVSPETVSQRVKLLRDALGDDPHEPRYVAGLRGRGYRIVAPVAQVAATPAAQGIPEEQRRPLEEIATRPSTSALRRWTVAASLAALVMLVATTAIVWIRTHNSSRTPSTPATSITVSALPERTVAVLPFENLSGQPPDEFVALGISEGVLHRLAAIPDLTLIARSSSFSFRGKSADARDIGLKLNARYLVEGSVQRAGDRLRVTAQLIDATTGAHVWSLRFDRTIDDIFAVEDEISHSVARALEVSLSQDTHPYARFGTDAYLAFMQGRALVATRKVTDAEQAIERFARAVELAPTFAAAHVALAGAYVHLAMLNSMKGSSSALAAGGKAEPILARALQLDASLGEAYVLRADLKAIQGDTSGALADYRKGLELSPNYGSGYEHLANFLADHGRMEEALVAIDKARLVDPLTPRNHYLKGLILLTQGSTQEAEALYLQTLEIAPDFHPALTRLAGIRAYRHGRYAEAVKLAEHAVALDPRTVWTLTRPVHFYLEMQDVDAARNFVVQQPASARAALWLPICLFERQPQRAADIMRANPDRWSDAMSEDVEAYMIRDAAFASGRLAEAMNELSRLPSDKSGGSYVLAVLAQLNLALGNNREAEKLARTLLSSNPARPDPVSRAIALALLGEEQAAIDMLERNPRGSWGRWWYTFEREPAFAPMRNDPRFQALAARARANALAQRRLLDDMRSRGDVPTRAASARAASTIC